MTSEAAKCIFNLELDFHGRNVGEAHACLKKQFGTNSSSQLFYQSLWVRKPIQFSKLIFLKKMLNHYKQMAAFQIAKFIFTSILHIIAYSWDLVKDLYFLAYYSHFGQISITNFGSFDSQVLIVLIISVTLPNVLNVLVLLRENLSAVPSKVRRFLMLVVFVSVSVTSYALNKIQYLNGRKQKLSEEQYPSAASRRDLLNSQSKRLTSKCQSRLQQKECQLRSLHAKLKINEGIFESSIQAIVLMITVAVSLRYIFLET